MSQLVSYAFGEFVLDVAQKRLLRREGAPVELTPRLFAALSLLVERAGDLVDKQQLLDRVWPARVVGENSLSQVIAGLRRILGDDAQGSRFIQTVPRKGFRFVASVAPAMAAKLAVLPFRLAGNQDRESVFNVGMADSLIARLSMLPGIVVVAPGSVSRFGEADRDPMRVACELGARWIVDGSVQCVGDRLRVIVRLLRADDGATAWADVLDREAAELFELQDCLANDIARALTEAAPPRGRLDHASPGGTRNLEAYQLYLAAAWRAQGGRAADIARSIALVNQALEIDPDYAQAWALLGWVHRRRLWNADARPSEVFACSDAAVQRAIALSPNLALARAGVGFSRFWYAYDWVGAEREFRCALDTNPSEANARWGLAFLLLTQGRSEEGFVHMRIARELDPLSPVWHTLEASFLTSAGRYPEAHRRLQVALDIAPSQWLAHAALGRLLLAEGETDSGLAELRCAVELGADTVRPKAHLAAQLAANGDRAAAQAILTELRERAAKGYVPPTSLAMVHAALGESQAALDELHRACELRDARLVELKGDPSWRPIRDHPRFVELLRRLNLDETEYGLCSV